MSMLVRGHVRGGRLKIDEAVDLPDDAEVQVAVLVDEDMGDELDEDDRARLHAALRASKAELDRGEVFPLDQVLAELP